MVSTTTASVNRLAEERKRVFLCAEAKAEVDLIDKGQPPIAWF
jgi:hypothetical protein